MTTCCKRIAADFTGTTVDPTLGLIDGLPDEGQFPGAKRLPLETAPQKRPPGRPPGLAQALDKLSFEELVQKYGECAEQLDEAEDEIKESSLPTQRDFAEHLHVSVRTVQRALRQKGKSFSDVKAAFSSRQNPPDSS